MQLQDQQFFKPQVHRRQVTASTFRCEAEELEAGAAKA